MVDVEDIGDVVGVDGGIDDFVTVKIVVELGVAAVGHSLTENFWSVR